MDGVANPVRRRGWSFEILDNYLYICYKLNWDFGYLEIKMETRAMYAILILTVSGILLGLTIEHGALYLFYAVALFAIGYCLTDERKRDTKK